MTTSQQTIARAARALARRFGVGGDAWDVTRRDAAGATVAVGTVAPLYVRQSPLSRLERLMGGQAAAMRAEYTAIYQANLVVLPEVGDTITSHQDATIAFLVTAISASDRPNSLVAHLERQPYT